jgi:hypothetical protein
MGFFDLPAPLFTALDSLFSGLPLFPRLLIWAALTGIISMLLYWLCSAQDKVGAAKERAITARKNMAGYTGTEFDEMMPLAKESLVASLKHFIIVLFPALLSSLPALTMIVWVSGQFSYIMPQPGETLSIATEPATELANLTAATDGTEGSYTVAYPDSDSIIQLTTMNGAELTTLPLAGAIPIVHKALWWNSLIGNPNGYLAEDADVDAIHFELQAIEYLSIGPGWVRGWEFSYFLLLIMVSLGIKVAFKIH